MLQETGPRTGRVLEDSAYVDLRGFDGDTVDLSEINWLSQAEFHRQGPDLVIESPSGEKIFLIGYYESETPPDLSGLGGAEIPAHIVEILSGPRAPGQFAQANGAVASEPIGQVETAEGTVFAVRVDGTRVQLKVGDPIYQGDTLETAEDGIVGVTFVDNSTLSLDEDGRMVIDELVYDPGTQDGSASMFVLQGAMSFVSGQLAKANPDAMQIETPVATIGIRGTSILLSAVPPEPGDDRPLKIAVALVPEGGLDGQTFVGEAVVVTQGGTQVIGGGFQAVTVDNPNAPPSSPVTVSLTEIGNVFGNALSANPNRGAVPENVREAVDKIVAHKKATEQKAELEAKLEEAKANGEDTSELEADLQEAAEAEQELKQEAEGAIEQVAQELGNPSLAANSNLTGKNEPVDNGDNGDEPDEPVQTPPEPPAPVNDPPPPPGPVTSPVPPGPEVKPLPPKLEEGKKEEQNEEQNEETIDPNKSPQAQADTVEVSKGGAKVFTVSTLLGNDTDPDGDPLRVTQVAGHSVGSGSWSETLTYGVLSYDGSQFTYTPNTNATGVDTIQYVISDGKGGGSQASVTFNITNTAPSADAVTLSGSEDSDLIFTYDNLIAQAGNTSGLDVNGDTVQLTSIDGHAVTFPPTAWSGPVVTTNGTLDFDGSNFTYTPNADFNGTAETFTYVVTDGAKTASGSVGIDVTPVNDAPEFTTLSGMTFDGVDDTISPPQTQLNNLPSGTIATWVKISDIGDGSAGSGSTITVNQLDFTNTTALFGVGLNDGSNLLASAGQVVFQSQNGTIFYSNSTIAEDTWVHLAVGFDGSCATLYINGVADKTVSGNYSIPNLPTSSGGYSLDPRIGGIHSSGNYTYPFEGNMDDIGVWNTRLSDAELLDVYNNGVDAFTDSNLRFYYDLDSSAAVDLTGNGFDGALNGPVSAIDVVVHEGASFNGSVTATDIDNLDSNLTFSLGTAPTHGAVTVNTDGTYTYIPATGYAGTDSFTVQVSDGNGGTNTETVTVQVLGAPTVNITGQSPLSFSTLYSDTAGNYGGVELGDIDGDGDLDMLISNNDTGSIAKWVNDGTGSFTQTTIKTWTNAVEAKRMQLVDLDGDGDLDMLALDTPADSVYLNNGSGDFSVVAQTDTNFDVTANNNRQGVAVGDIDGDGDQDFVQIMDNGNSVYFNEGSGQFVKDTSQSIGVTGDKAGKLFDIDNDGDLDLVSIAWGYANEVFLNDGSGVFGDGTTAGVAAQSFANTEAGVDVEWGDFNNDGYNDFIVFYRSAANEVYLNDATGTGSFTLSGTFGLTTPGRETGAVGDIDGDGDLDAIAGQDGNEEIHLNDGSGNFTAATWSLDGAGAATTNYIGGWAYDTEIGDINGDGLNDFVQANPSGGHNGLHIIENTSLVFDYDCTGGAVLNPFAVVSINDPESTSLQSATVTIKGFSNGDPDLLALGTPANHPSIVASFDSATGVLSLSGDATVAEYEAAIADIEFGGANVIEERQLELTVMDDSGQVSAAKEVTINVTTTDPIVLDLDGDGVELTSAAHGVAFDVNADGDKEQIGWVGSDDGVLAFDVNQDGQINDMSEIISHYFSYQDRNSEGLTSSQEVLALYDDNGDNVIDAQDEIYQGLSVWQDVNGDGLTDDGELRSLADEGIQSISLEHTTLEDGLNGNLITKSGTALSDTGEVLSWSEVTFELDEAALLKEIVGTDQDVDTSVLPSDDTTAPTVDVTVSQDSGASNATVSEQDSYTTTDVVEDSSVLPAAQ